MNIEVLDIHGRAVYLFMGAGDVQKYLNEFKSHLDKKINNLNKETNGLICSNRC